MSHITSTERFAKAGPYTYTYPMKNTLIGYARCSTDKQDLSAQGQGVVARIGCQVLTQAFATTTDMLNAA